jgi:hypothetical protein
MFQTKWEATKASQARGQRIGDAVVVIEFAAFETLPAPACACGMKLYWLGLQSLASITNCPPLTLPGFVTKMRPVGKENIKISSFNVVL